MSHAVLTGPIRGYVTLDDGREFNVEPELIYLDSVEDAQQVAHLIGERHQTEGHPHHDANTPFVHDADTSAANFTQEG